MSHELPSLIFTDVSVSSKTLITYLVLYSKLARLQISCISSIVSIANIQLVFVCVHVFVLTCVFCFRLHMLILVSFLGCGLLLSLVCIQL